MKKSWREKLADDKGLPKVGKVTGKMSQRWGTGMMVIPAPREVDALMRQVPKGRLVTINELRAALAKKNKVGFACPITTGIFSWIAAHAAAEAETEGAKRITPYRRTLKTGGEVNPKYPGGVRRYPSACAPKATSLSAKASACSWRTTRRSCSANFAEMKTGPRFPLTLTLSLGERGQRWTHLLHSNVSFTNPAAGFAKVTASVSPSPRGEGRGEGEPNH